VRLPRPPAPYRRAASGRAVQEWLKRLRRENRVVPGHRTTRCSRLFQAAVFRQRPASTSNCASLHSHGGPVKTGKPVGRSCGTFQREYPTRLPFAITSARSLPSIANQHLLRASGSGAAPSSPGSGMLPNSLGWRFFQLAFEGDKGRGGQERGGQQHGKGYHEPAAACGQSSRSNQGRKPGSVL